MIATEADWAKGFTFGGENKVSVVQLPRQTMTSSLWRTLSCYSVVLAFQDLCNLHLISYDDCLIDDGKFIVLYDLYYSILEAFSSSRSFCFCFEVKSKYRSRTALGLQLLLILAAEENSVLLQCSPIFVLSQSSFLITTSCSGVHWK